jgi:hypothetical protein
MSAVPAIQAVIGAAGRAADTALRVAGFFTKHWAKIAPVVYTVIGALTLYNVALAVTSIQTRAASGNLAILTMAQNVYATATKIAAAATVGFGAAIKAIPISWILTLIGAAVGAIFAFVHACGGLKAAWLTVANYFTFYWDTIRIVFMSGVYAVLDMLDSLKLGWLNISNSITGIVENLSGSLRRGWLTISNSVLSVVENMLGRLKLGWLIVSNGIIGIVEKVLGYLKSGWLNASNAVLGFVDNMRNGILSTLQNMINSVIKGVNLVISALNKLPKVNIKPIEMVDFSAGKRADAIAGQRQAVESNAASAARADAIAGQRRAIEANADARKNAVSANANGNGNTRERAEAIAGQRQAAAANADARKKSLAAMESGAMANLQDRLYKIEDARKVTKTGNELSSMVNIQGLDGVNRNTAEIAGNTARANEITEENIKYLRDIAERDTINQFTTAEIKFDMGGVTNNVNSGLDLNGLMDFIEEGVSERLLIAAEGVYA